MRLAAQAKMGYYPTPDTIMPMIAKYLKRERKGLIRVLDPCAGEGTAIRFIGDYLESETYGIEIDIERGSKAKDILTQCLITDYQNTTISHQAFSLLWLNPPYDWAARNDENETSERHERIFLRDCIPYLRLSGIMVYLIPQRRLDVHIARMLSYRFERISVFRFPEESYRAYKQLVILGVLKKKPDKDNEMAEYLKNCGRLQAVVPFLPENPPQIYSVSVSPSKGRFIFRSRDIDPEELAVEVERYGLFPKIADMTTPLSMTEKIRPIMPLRHGHLAQVLACGLMNGVVWDRERRNPLLIKGITKKEVKRSVEIQGEGVEKHIERDQIKIIINAFDRSGQMLTIE